MAINSKKNFALLFIDTVLFVNAMTFLSITTVITYFLITLGASTLQISLANILVSIGTFVSQPLFAKKAAELPLKSKYFSVILLVQRIILLTSILLLPKMISYSSRFTIIAFLISWGVFNFFVGSYTPFYMALLSKVTERSQIGRLKGFSGAFGNILALGSASMVGIMLKNISYPYNYTLIFTAGVFLLFIDAVVFWLFDEPSEEIGTKSQTHFEFLKDIPSILRNDRTFVKLIAGCAMFVISNISLVYYTLYATRRFDAQAGEVALFMTVTVVVNIIGNIFFGLLADRFSHRLVLILSAAAGIAAAVTVLSINSLYAVYAALVLSGLCSCGYMLSGSIMIMRCSPQVQIPTYFLIYNVISLVTSSIITMISGILIDSFSFTPLFVITGVSAALSLLIFVFFHPVRDQG